MTSGWCEIQTADFTLGGYSLAGEETCFAAPELNLGFDIGRAPREMLAVDHIFLSHGHMDHAAGVAYYFSQRMFIDNAPGNLYAAEPLIEPFRELLRLWGEIDGNEPAANLHAIIPGEDIDVRRGLIVRPFEVRHACRGRNRQRFNGLGFSVIEVRKKLLEEYQGLMGPQIVELKRQGVEIERRVEVPLLTYCGDTALGDFLELPHVRESKLLLLECTFVDPDHVERARAGHHMHVSDLAKVIPGLNNERIVLTHLTRRTPLHIAKAALRQVLGDTEGRVSFLGEHRKRRKPRPASSEPDRSGVEPS
jgi:ribonuclease Z